MRLTRSTLLALAGLAAWAMTAPASAQGVVFVEERLIPTSWEKPLISFNQGRLTYKPARPVLEKRVFGTAMGVSKVGVTLERVAGSAAPLPRLEGVPGNLSLGQMIRWQGQVYRVDGGKDGKLILWSPVFQRAVYAPAAP